jgi:hypothetical protein
MKFLPANRVLRGLIVSNFHWGPDLEVIGRPVGG